MHQFLKFVFLCFVLLQEGAVELETTGTDISTTPAPVDFAQCETAIGCECWDLGGNVGVSCSNVTDFGVVTRGLSDGSIFQFNETFEINFSGVTTLPPRSLEGLIVFRLILDDPQISNISPQAFDGVLKLRRIYIASSSINVIPNVTGLSMLMHNLIIENSLLTTVGRELQNLTRLERLALRNNSIHSVDENAFLGTNSITILDLSWNLIESLPFKLVANLVNLTKLTLSHNRLHTVHGLLEGSKLKIALLNNNNLTNADNILPERKSQIETLLLSWNPLGNSITVKTFNNRIPKARFLYLDNCQIPTFDERYFTKLNLSSLDLSGNLLQTIPNQEIGFGFSLELFFNHNKISKFEGKLSYKVKRIYMAGNQMSFLGTAFRLTQITDIDMSDNHLEALMNDDFRSSHQTENISFRRNYIQLIERDTFATLRNFLQNLDLSSNRLESLNGSMRFFSRLKSLNISYNSISSLQEGEFAGLNELSSLIMQHNHIYQLGGSVQRLPILRLLNIRDNRVSVVHVHDLPTSLQYLFFQENPIACDCRILEFVEWINGSKSLTVDDSSYCKSSLVNASDVQRDAQPCPWPCDCRCTKDVNGSYIAANCQKRNIMNPPDLFIETGESKSFASMFVFQSVNPIFTVSDRLVILNLENNNLTTLAHWAFPWDLKDLRMANNQIKSLPDSVLDLPNLKKATMSGNPWSCHCEDVERRKWLLSKGEGISDINKTHCGPGNDLAGRLLISLTDVDLCPSSVWFYIPIAISIFTLMFLVFSAIIAYNRYQIPIKIWLYAHGVTWVKEKDVDKDKMFDAFVSFSNDDMTFVIHQIIEELECRVPNIRLCLHYRNFKPGEYIHNNIMNAVKNSKRTVLVLSKNFLESDWCLLEFRAAHLQALEDKIHRLIVVKVGELPEDIDPAIKAYLDSTTYIMWGEKQFWQKMLYVLPSPDKHYRKTDDTIFTTV